MWKSMGSSHKIIISLNIVDLQLSLVSNKLFLPSLTNLLVLVNFWLSGSNKKYLAIFIYSCLFPFCHIRLMLYYNQFLLKLILKNVILVKPYDNFLH